jgi:hypothetical protein
LGTDRKVKEIMDDMAVNALARLHAAVSEVPHSLTFDLLFENVPYLKMMALPRLVAASSSC